MGPRRLGARLFFGGTMKKTLLAISLFALLFACAPKKPLTFEEQQMLTASEQCKQEATDMNPENPWGDNPFWSSYYEMCMNRFGYTSKQISRLWY